MSPLITLKHEHLLFLLVVFVVLLTAGFVEARVGGGESLGFAEQWRQPQRRKRRRKQ
ncbi:MAG: hypothetical protein U0792_06450 [Gemmataceae bacterium]